jgi:hypothetical protein
MGACVLLPKLDLEYLLLLTFFALMGYCKSRDQSLPLCFELSPTCPSGTLVHTLGGYYTLDLVRCQVCLFRWR